MWLSNYFDSSVIERERNKKKTPYQKIYRNTIRRSFYTRKCNTRTETPNVFGENDFCNYSEIRLENR